jgi:hypothetical protein
MCLSAAPCRDERIDDMGLTRKWAVNTLAVFLLLPLACGLSCRMGINPAGHWMMQHDCPFSRLPSSPRPLPGHPMLAPMDR